MIVAVAGCVAQAEGAEIMRRAPAVDLVVGPQTYHRLPRADRPRRIATSGAALVETDFPAEEKFDAPARARARKGGDGVPHRAGGLRQVLHLLRRALHARRRVLAARRRRRGRGRAALPTRACARSRCWARTSTPTTAQGRTAAPGAGAADRPAGRDRRPRAHPLHDQPSRATWSDDLIAAHGEQPKLMPYLHLPVQSGADRILAAMNRKHTAATICAWSPASAPPGPTWRCPPTSSSAFPARPRPISQATLELVERGRLRPGLLVQIQPAPRHAGRRHGRSGARRASRSSGCIACRLLLDRAADGVQFRLRRQGHAVLFERAGRHPGQLVGRSPYLQRVHASGFSLFGASWRLQLPAPAPIALGGARTRAAEAIQTSRRAMMPGRRIRLV